MAAGLPQHRLGRSEIKVSRIALGSWRTFERMPRADAERLLGYALERGIDFLDDARYNDETGSAPIPTGYSEVLFGQLLRAVGADQDALTISNKLWWEFWPGQDAIGELEASLERMGLNRLGLLYSSTLPAEVPVPVAVEQIAAVLATGRVGTWAVVNWSAADLAAATAAAARAAIPPPCAAQLPYSLARTGWVEDPAMDDALAAAGASLIPSAALAGGALSGKYAEGASGRLRDELRDPSRGAALQLGAALRRPAAALDTTPATLAIAFTLLHPRTAATLIGATTPAQIDAAIDAVQLAGRLTADDVAELRSLTDSRLPAGALCTGGSVLPRDEAEDYLRTRNRRMVTAPDRVLLTGSRSILARPGMDGPRSGITLAVQRPSHAPLHHQFVRPDVGQIGGSRSSNRNVCRFRHYSSRHRIYKQSFDSQVGH